MKTRATHTTIEAITITMSSNNIRPYTQTTVSTARTATPHLGLLLNYPTTVMIITRISIHSKDYPKRRRSYQLGSSVPIMMETRSHVQALEKRRQMQEQEPPPSPWEVMMISGMQMSWTNNCLSS